MINTKYNYLNGQYLKPFKYADRTINAIKQYMKPYNCMQTNEF